MPPGLHRLLLRLFALLPRRIRRLLVRWGTPSFTVGALCVIRRPDGRILLVRQSYRQGWGLPGGLMARGEVPADAARREVEEEVGLAIELGAPTVVVEPVPRRVDVVFAAVPRSGQVLDDLVPRSPEIVTIEWFEPESMPRLQAETVSALDALARSEGGPLPVEVESQGDSAR